MAERHHRIKKDCIASYPKRGEDNCNANKGNGRKKNFMLILFVFSRITRAFTTQIIFGDFVFAKLVLIMRSGDEMTTQQ